MRLLVFGAGVIGSLYAGRLATAGHEVSLVARGERLRTLRSKGLVLVEEGGGKEERPQVSLLSPEEVEGHWDYILIAVRREQLEEALPSIAALAGTATVVTMVNTADGGGAAKTALGGGRLVLGFPGAGGTIRDDGAVVYRVMAGLIQRTTFGESEGGGSARVRDLVRACSAAGFPSAVSRDMASWQRSHIALVSPIANSLYVKGGDIRAYARDLGLIAMTVDAIREGFGVVRALGGRVRPVRMGILLALPRCLIVPVLARALASDWGDTVIARHANKARMEMRSISADLVALADLAGSEAPALRQLACFA